MHNPFCTSPFWNLLHPLGDTTTLSHPLPFPLEWEHPIILALLTYWNSSCFSTIHSPAKSNCPLLTKGWKEEGHGCSNPQPNSSFYFCYVFSLNSICYNSNDKNDLGLPQLANKKPIFVNAMKRLLRREAFQVVWNPSNDPESHFLWYLYHPQLNFFLLCDDIHEMMKIFPSANNKEIWQRGAALCVMMPDLMLPLMYVQKQKKN